MRVKHSPRPWKMDYQGYVMAPQPDVAETGEELPPEYEVASIGDGSGILTIQEKADGRLIVAAPELLAAAKDMMEWLDESNFGGKRTTALREAIAEAEGKESP